MVAGLEKGRCLHMTVVHAKLFTFSENTPTTLAFVHTLRVLRNTSSERAIVPTIRIGSPFAGSELVATCPRASA